MAPETRSGEIRLLEDTLKSLVMESQEHLKEMIRNVSDRQSEATIALSDAIKALDNRYKDDLNFLKKELMEDRATPKPSNQAGILRTPNFSPVNSSGTYTSAPQVNTMPNSSMDALFTRLPKIEFPKFSGENVMGWVFRCEQFFEISQTPNEWKVKLACIYLDGIALEWHQNFTRTISIPIDWNVYKEAIKERFGNTAFDDPMYELNTLRQTGTVQEYNNYFDAILTRLNLPEPYAISCYLGGLKEELLGLVRIMKPKSLREAFSLAKMQESTLNQQQKRVKGWNKPGIGEWHNNMGSRPGIGTSETGMSKQPTLNSRNPTSNQQQGDNSRRILSNTAFDEKRAKGLCFWCNEKYSIGHQCKKRQLYQITLIENELMDNEEVEEPKEELESTPTEMGIEANISLNAVTGLPSYQAMTVIGATRRKQIYILIDTGSTHNFVDPSILNFEVDNVTQIPVQYVTVANGDRIPITQEVHNLQWSMQGVVFSTEALVMPLENYHMILGIQWLSELGNVSWNFKELQMTFTLHDKQIRLIGIKIPIIQLTREKHWAKLLQNASVALYIQFFSSLIAVTDKPLQKLTIKQQKELDAILGRHSEVFTEPSGLPPHRTFDHQITLKEGTNPISVRPYRYPALQKSAIERLISEMKESGIIRESISPFSSPVVLIKKKDGSWRLCIDYRELNAKTIRDKFPIPVIEELLDELHGSQYFSKMDLRSGYWQVRMFEDDIRKTAFRTHEGHYEFLVMPFGLTNAPATFQRLMNSIFKPFLRQFVLVFFDDILIYSKSWQEHLQHLKQVFDVIVENSLKLKKSKCMFATQTIEYLGHYISAEGVTTDPTKIQAIIEWPTPSSVKELRGFLGLAGYYRRFIKDYGKISKGLTDLLKKNSFTWNDQAKDSFQHLKGLLSKPPVLALPNFSQPFTIETDASGTGIGAILMQAGRPIAFFSKALSEKHQKLPVYERELLAMVAAIQKWRPYLIDNHFKVKTDHQSLRFLLEQRISTPAQQKWISKLAGYDFEILYKKGNSNTAADALSRRNTMQTLSLNAILQGLSTDILQAIQQSWTKDEQLSAIINQLKMRTTLAKPYSWRNNQLHWKGKLAVGNDMELRTQLVKMIHTEPAGGHSGFQPTLHRLKEMYHWKGMGQTVKNIIRECDICQRNKYETTAPAGLLQPLPIPERIWTDVSLDFIEGLPKSHGKNAILVVVDHLSKYAHFLALTHPYTAALVAQIYLDNVYKLHGMPEKLICDRDAVFLSRFWMELLKLLKVSTNMSTAYHPQTDGQTEVVNRCLETYLRCMSGERPKDWAQWLPLSEWWYNTNYHSSTKTTPYEIV
ncbi:putative mitochondrial protein [Apostasia shenzhenica]|uniref:RNA-directed DNA polymerase n=1 Tax=Apostasia shenzhenica TaxID=1088818 RepID=A0A2I0BA94_9ASPA|nr:putative mitochondrial protein [Apostasia shenzhenica]